MTISRRTMLSGAAVGLAASPAIAATAASTWNGKSESMTRVHVESEFAPLRTVVLTQSQVAFSKNMAASDDTRFLDGASVDALKDGGDFADLFPEKQKAWEAEREAFGQILIGHGVEVLRPRLLTDAEKAAAGDNGYANFFVRDPFFTVGPNVIEGSLRFLHRRREVLPVRPTIEQRVLPSNAAYLAVPMPEIAAKDEKTLGAGPFLEGGDVLVLGRHVFVGTSGLATNAHGVRFLSKLLTPQGYTVERVRLRDDILHLDCALGLIRDGLMVACRDAFLDGIPDLLKDWERIDVSLEEAKALATNGLPLTDRVYVTDPAFATIGNALRRHGIAVEYVKYDISRSFGGSFRCSTQPLLRRS